MYSDVVVIRVLVNLMRTVCCLLSVSDGPAYSATVEGSTGELQCRTFINAYTLTMISV